MFVSIPSKNIPLAGEYDLCVVGGSCTGLFAAVRAARLGLSVALIEKQNCLGGVATAGLINVWHSLLDDNYENQVIAGLTDEVMQRMVAAGYAKQELRSSHAGFRFSSEQLKIELDSLAVSAGINLFLHAHFIDLIRDGNKITALTFVDKDGQRAIRAKFFIDATGDGDLCKAFGMQSYTLPAVQPPSACFMMQGSTDNVDLAWLIGEHGDEFGLDDDWGWAGYIPELDGITMRADNHVFDVRCDKAADLTRAEIEGRKKMRALIDLLKKYGDKSQHYALVNTCSVIGVRETVHYKTEYTANESDLLLGKRFDDAVMNGAYRIDIHHSGDNGITFKYLNGQTHTMYGKSSKSVYGNWRKDLGLSGEPAHYYQVPFSVLRNSECENMIAAGRMINADPGAYGALRVMVNLNQLGEAAGVAAALCVDSNITLQALSGVRVREALSKGGSAL
jgi:hypothetical protein